MSRSSQALINPDLLVWVRTNAGYTVEDIAHRLNVTPDQIESWEKGEKRPTVNQLRNIGKACKRPLAVFYLPEPPKDFQVLNDYRRIPGAVAGFLSPTLRFEIRRAYDRRDLALDLYDNLGLSPSVFTHSANHSDDPDVLANTIRNFLDIQYNHQITWHKKDIAFNHWRSSFERAGILVFQSIGIAVEEMRGFSIFASPLPAIVVNNKDKPAGKIFTMLHELIHIMLHEGSICDLHEEPNQPPEKNRIEIFCNAVTGAVLVPRRNLLQERIVKIKGNCKEWTDDELNTLANKYGVSNEVLLRRLLLLKCTSPEFYHRKRSQYIKAYSELNKKRKGFAPPHRVAINSSGYLFTQLVLGNYYQDKITISRLSDLLNIRLKHLAKIESDVMSYISKYGAIT